MSVTYYSGNRILDKSFGAVNFTPASTMYVGLSTTPIAIDGTGITEPSGGSYARVAIANDKTTWSTASNASLANAIQIAFPESSASWGTITHIFISDAASGGNILYFEAISPTRTVAISTTVLFAIGAMTVSMTN